MQRLSCWFLKDDVEVSFVFEDLYHFGEHLKFLTDRHIFIFEDLVPGEFASDSFKEDGMSCISADGCVDGALASFW